MPFKQWVEGSNPSWLTSLREPQAREGCHVEAQRRRANPKPSTQELRLGRPSSRDVFKKAYKIGLLQDEKLWLDMIQDRNLTAHTYNQKLADEILKRIRERYQESLSALGDALGAEMKKQGLQ